MKNIGILPWWNENSLTPYPLTKGFGYNGFLVAANFIQFDNFIPVLKEILVDDTEVVITLVIDAGEIVSRIDIEDLVVQGHTKKLYDATRYIGTLVFGINSYSLVKNDMANQTLKNLNISFLSTTVKSIPTTAGVYSLQKEYGSLTLGNTDGVITYETGSSTLTINAISYPPVKSTTFLKSINSVPPQGNNLYLLDNQVIKYKSAGASELEISLVGNGEGVIVTNG